MEKCSDNPPFYNKGRPTPQYYRLYRLFTDAIFENETNLNKLYAFLLSLPEGEKKIMTFAEAFRQADQYNRERTVAQEREKVKELDAKPYKPFTLEDFISRGG
jgi:hypothetical protein